MHRALHIRTNVTIPCNIGTPEVTQLAANISAIYSPELIVDFTTTSGNERQNGKSFYPPGYPATKVFKHTSPIADPMYHSINYWPETGMPNMYN
ncbi:hypothetical protein EDC04DRAFT_1055924 [Pisolithus marmoratus]|nr:hypothetical protein EDC04DRAFT_1055924 [Pisolithus marmoratus]